MSNPYGGPLVTPGMLTALRGFAYAGLQTEVHILRRQTMSNPYGDDSEAWVETAQTWGWFKQMNDPYIREEVGVASTTGVFRLELPVGIELDVGDMVGVEGAEYMVENTSVEDTVQVFLEAYVRIVT